MHGEMNKKFTVAIDIIVTTIKLEYANMATAIIFLRACIKGWGKNRRIISIAECTTKVVVSYKQPLP